METACDRAVDCKWSDLPTAEKEEIREILIENNLNPEELEYTVLICQGCTIYVLTKLPDGELVQVCWDSYAEHTTSAMPDSVQPNYFWAEWVEANLSRSREIESPEVLAREL